VFDVPLLAESSHWRARVERVLVVDCPAELQIRRVMRRSGWDEAAVRRVIAQQATREHRRAIADGVIHNGEATSLDDLARAVGILWGTWVGGH
jgi:dephospho-CoA kinase